MLDNWPMFSSSDVVLRAMEVNKDDNNAADTILPKNVAPAGVMEYIYSIQSMMLPAVN